MMKALNKKRKKGFTLIELIVVIAILGILAAIAIPRFATVTDDANDKAALTEHALAVSAVRLYQAANAGVLPTATTDLDAYIQDGYAALDVTVVTFESGDVVVTTTSKGSAAGNKVTTVTP